MRKRSLDMVHALAKRDERVVFIGSDLSPNLLGEMKKEFPSRYYMEGIAEANVIGMAAGMAMEGFIPYVNTIATFITRRCYEQVAVDLCLHDLPVRLIGNGGGYVYAPLGPTHQAIEDIAIMRALPHMTVTAVCDADEMTRLMDASLEWPHPIYIRLAKGGDPVISKPERGFAIGKAIDMIDGSPAQSDVLLICTGVATTEALKAAKTLSAESIRCRLLHVHTVKPLDTEAILQAASNTRLIVTVEEHNVVGGLGSAVLEALADGLTGSLPPVKRLGIPDRFSDRYGSQQALMASLGFDANGISAAVRAALAGAKQ
ncbi:MAG: transketolase [Alphaproteobacteria bacterium]|nr:transketolase [Alphaproteobacteria bacterium]MBV8408173.1 transketolase [Alphaproteobacteria bacterium]